MSEIRYGKTPLPECCKRIGERVKQPYSMAFWSIYQKMEENTGDSFAEIFCSQMEKCLMQFPLSSQDREQFLSFAEGNSFGDGSMQIRSIERSRELLQITVKNLERENAEKCRMAVGLGAMSGLLLIIILL